jgi:PAS domain S-box-containing protein
MAYRSRNDADWTLEFASDGCKALTGYAAEDLVGNKLITFEEVIHVEDRRRTRNEIEAAVQKGEPYEITYRILRPNQEERWIWDKGRLVEQGDLGFDFMEGFMTDITELVNRQRALETLHAGGLTLGKSLDPHEIGQSIIRVLEERLDWHHAAVRVSRQGTDEIELLAFSEPHAHPSDHDQKKETVRSGISRLGEGKSGWVIAHGETIRSSYLAEDPRYVAVFQDMRSGLYVPIVSARRTIGCISVEDDRPESFSAEDERVLTTLASQAAVALENARLIEAERLRRQDAETLQQAAASLASSLDAEKLIDELLEGLAKVISFDSVTVFIQDGENVRAMAGKGPVSTEITIGRVLPSDAIFDQIQESRMPIIIPDVREDPRFADWGSQGHVRGWMGVPMIAAGQADRISHPG